jgi:hypothetical protein
MTADESPVGKPRRAGLAVPGAETVGHAVAPQADAVARGLRTSPTFWLVGQVYPLHRREGTGRCRSCASGICRSLGHAAVIIAAAGVGPADVDAPTGCGHRPRRKQGDVRRRRTSLARVNGVHVGPSRPSPECHDRNRPRGLSVRRPHRRGDEIVGALLPNTDVDVPCLADPFPLQGSLFCACGTALFPVGLTRKEAWVHQRVWLPAVADRRRCHRASRARGSDAGLPDADGCGVGRESGRRGDGFIRADRGWRNPRSGAIRRAHVGRARRRSPGWRGGGLRNSPEACSRRHVRSHVNPLAWKEL